MDVHSWTSPNLWAKERARESSRELERARELDQEIGILQVFAEEYRVRQGESCLASCTLVRPPRRIQVVATSWWRRSICKAARLTVTTFSTWCRSAEVYALDLGNVTDTAITILCLGIGILFVVLFSFSLSLLFFRMRWNDSSSYIIGWGPSLNDFKKSFGRLERSSDWRRL